MSLESQVLKSFYSKSFEKAKKLFDFIYLGKVYIRQIRINPLRKITNPLLREKTKNFVFDTLSSIFAVPDTSKNNFLKILNCQNISPAGENKKLFLYAF